MSRPAHQHTQDGFSTPTVLGLLFLMSIIMVAVLSVVQANIRLVSNNIKSQAAMNIAEAGINYYLWHLSHDADDFQDATGQPTTPDATLGYGPYEHDYIDDNGVKQGTYTLWIKQSPNSSIVKVRSIGKIDGSSIERTLEAQIGAPSFASYGVLADVALWFGNTETATGPVHSNVGVRMDGLNTAEVSSANTTYVPPSSLGGDGSSHPGVWCSTSVTSPVNCNTRNKSTWLYPLPSVDFNQVSGSLCDIKKLAFSSNAATASLATQANACSQTPNTRTSAYIPQRATNGSYNERRGYLIELNTGGTYNLYQVNNETDTQSTYSSALSPSLVASNITIPSDGVIFVEDNVWVRSNPTFHGRVTIGAGRLATSWDAQITIADDLVYSAKDGSDAIGLIAEGDASIAPYASPSSGSFNFEVDAAILSQSGSVHYPNVYRAATSTCTKGWINSNQKFIFYGSVASRQSWTWTWIRGSSCGNAVYDSSSGYYTSGIKNNDSQYDYNLLYSPPPKYPITSTYSILSWREVLTSP